MEGTITVLVGLTGLVFLVDFPEKAARSRKFLSQRQADWVILRVQRDRGDATAEAFSMKKFLNAGRDVRLWCFAVIFW